MIIGNLFVLFCYMRLFKMSTVDCVHPYFAITIDDYYNFPVWYNVFTNVSIRLLSKVCNLANHDILIGRFLLFLNPSTVINWLTSYKEV